MTAFPIARRGETPESHDSYPLPGRCRWTHDSAFSLMQCSPTLDWDKPNCRAICDGLTPAFRGAQQSGSAVPVVSPTALRYLTVQMTFTGADMTAHTPERISTQLADWSILVTGKSTPPRDPNDDDEEEEDDGDAESDEDEPAVIREPDE
jgi:hypothetical protein